jgi:hypothetical protein
MSIRKKAEKAGAVPCGEYKVQLFFDDGTVDAYEFPGEEHKVKFLNSVKCVRSILTIEEGRV